jgi:EAL domain-containing protein (putative c-di-GMP-specific phosphodiesterase class I)/signal transduction histidine kinase
MAASRQSASVSPQATKVNARDSQLKTLLNRLVLACVGFATLAAAAGTGWRTLRDGGHMANPSAHDLILGLASDVAAGGVALLFGVWLAARLHGRLSASVTAVAQALAELAADPDPDQRKPIEVELDIAGLAQAYNDVLVGLGRRERQMLMHATAQAEKRRLTELATLRQDINAPLAAIKSLAKGLAGDGDAPAFARREHRIAEALGRVGESLLATVDDLIGRTEMSPNSFEMHPQAVDLAELTEDVSALLWTHAIAKGLDFAVYVDPQTPQYIRVDPVRLRQIIGGLASCSIAATSKGGVLIEVEPDSPTSIRISVHDTGPALAPGGERTTPCFALDTRPGDTDATLPFRLAAYRQMVKAMGGAFAPTRHRDRGATFAFRLPAQVAQTPALWAGAALVAAASNASAPEDRVLLAVSGPCTRRALSRYLARAGLAVGVYDGTVPETSLRLAIGDAATLEAIGPLKVPVIPLIPPHTSKDRAGALNQPLCRGDLEALLRKFRNGQLMHTVGAAPAPPVTEGRRSTVDLAMPYAPALTDDERALIADLAGAADREEFSLAYQPQVDREGEKILGVEALLRWTHPTRGAVSPAIFIPLAERVGKIADITTWVLDRVLAETHYLTGLQVSFNASALEFAQKGFVDWLLAAIADNGYDARRLEVEITETAILEHGTSVRENMDRLHAVGIGVVLDDFGAGYSSISHLRRYPFDKLKIDREFITDCTRDMQSATVVHAVVSIGRALGMKVIAEGVETETQRSFLRIAGVHAMQGYLFGKAVPIDNLARLISPGGARAWG